jgi:hypothetical protein
VAEQLEAVGVTRFEAHAEAGVIDGGVLRTGRERGQTGEARDERGDAKGGTTGQKTHETSQCRALNAKDVPRV